MSARRTVLLSLLLLVLAAIAAASWLYLRLPSLVAVQGQEYLNDYGVDSIATTPPRLGYGEVYLDKLTLEGQRDGAGFAATLENVAVSYSIATLALGELKRLDIGRLTLALERPASQNTSPGSAPSPTPGELLPQSIEALLPIGRLSIGELVLTGRIGDQPALSARGRLEIEDTLKLSLDTVWQGLHIAAVIETTQTPSDADISLLATHAGQSIGRVNARSTLKPDQAWAWQVQSALDIQPLRHWLSTPAAREAALLDTATLTQLEELEPEGHLAVDGSLAHLDTSDPTLLADSLSGDIHLEGSRLGVRLDGDHRVSAAFNGSLAKTPAGIQLALESSQAAGTVATSRLAIDEKTRDSFLLGDVVEVAWQQDARLTLSRDPVGQLKVRDLTGTVSATSGRTALSLGLASTAVDLHPDAKDNLSLRSVFTIAGRLRGETLPTLAGTASLAAGEDENSQALSVRVAERDGALSVMLSGEGRPLDGTGRYQAELTLATLNGAIKRYLPLLPPDGAPANLPQLTAGNLGLSTRIDANGWQTPERWRWDSRLGIDALSLRHDEYTVEDIHLDAAWQGLTRWQTRQPIQLDIAKISAGLSIEALSAQISLPQPTPPAKPAVRLETLELSLLGGRAFLPEPQQWDFSGKRNSLALAVEDLALSDIVALQQNRQISAEGRLSGLLPVRVTGERITIDKGHVRAAEPGGIIRYRPDEASAALAANSRELGMALQLLDDFHFDVLSSEVELDETGNLLLALSLAGRNPGYEKGRAINFNINLEQNIDPLLQSLRLGGSVVEQLEKKRR